MGAWATGVLQNDTALDIMPEIAETENLDEVVEMFLNSTDADEQLVGVAIVDASFNGADENLLGNFYEYQEFFEGLSGKPIEKLDLARKALKEAETDIDRWVEKCKASRLELYRVLETRLGMKH